jgi:hypothetical protein
MKKILTLVFLITLSSCSEINYVDLNSLNIEGDIAYTQNGKKFTGIVVVTRNSNSEQLRVERTIKVKDGESIESKDFIWEDDKLNYKEIELSNGVKTYVSDNVIRYTTRTFEINYFDNGSIYSKIEHYYNDDKGEFVLDGESVTYDEDGEINNIEVYKDGELISYSQEKKDYDKFLGQWSDYENLKLSISVSNNDELSIHYYSGPCSGSLIGKHIPNDSSLELTHTSSECNYRGFDNSHILNKNIGKIDLIDGEIVLDIKIGDDLLRKGKTFLSKIN